MLNVKLHSARFGLAGGVLLFLIMLLLPAPDGLNVTAWNTAAVTALMAILWMTEAIPIAATALLPVILFPVLGILPIGDTTAPYANPLIFLFMGGFVIAIAMQKWNLHRRIALRIVNFVGTDPKSIVIGFIIASSFISMWVSNTATALMMLPIALSVMEFLPSKNSNENKTVSNFEIVLVLSIAYACSIGGLGTLIGSPPNALFAAFMLENYNLEISFIQWMIAGVPLVILILPVMYLILSKWIYPIDVEKLPGSEKIISDQLQALGQPSAAEQRVFVLFSVTALLWIFRPYLVNFIPGLSDAGIAIAAALLLFLIPGGVRMDENLLQWKDARALPWGILILFGGGLSLASAINSTGLAAWLGEVVSGLGVLPVVVIVAIVILLMIFLTEITSNTATAATLLPILASVAIGLGQNPLLFAVPATLAATCAFMLPVATPPNAIVYGSGRVTIAQMAKAGFWLNIVVSVILTVATYSLFLYLFGVEIDVIPDWAG